MKFFKGISDVFVCDSWLLHPNLGNLLGEGFNISRFQQDYDILWINEDSRQFEERVFGMVQDDIENYPENTLLQRKGKEFLRKGGKIGTALGSFQFEY